MNKLSKWLPTRKGSNGESALQRSSGVHPMERMREEMNRMFDSFFRDPFAPLELDWPRSFQSLELSPRVDIEDRKKEIRVSVELPGLEPDDVEVDLADNTLTVKGEKKTEESEERDGYYLSERSYGAFQRVIPLPVEVEPDKVKARFKRGVLTVRLPKSERARENVRKIAVSGED